MKLKHLQINTFWTIWAIGYYQEKDHRNQTFLLEIYIGPIVLSFWR